MMLNYRRPSRWEAFAALVLRGLKIFLFYLSVLVLCRIFFCLWMQPYWGAATGAADVELALGTGTRLSVQTAGIMMLVTVVPAGLLRLVSARGQLLLERALSGLTLMVTSILFVASFPYYHQFHSRFHQILFNTANDDVYALFWSLVLEFYLPVRLAGALLLGWGMWRLLQSFLDWQWEAGAELWHMLGQLGRWLQGLLLTGVLTLLGLLIVYGGSLSWERATDWENAGVTRDAFLNEVILDDYQAIYRGYRLNGRLVACNGLNFTAEQIQQLAGWLAKRSADSSNLDDYLWQEAQGPQVPKPRQIFVIVSESYANWPLLDKYSQLHIADGMKEIIAAEDSDYCPAFLPNGSSTVSAVTGIVTGLADANLYFTTMPESYAAPYITAVAPQMEQLGYATHFWYAGPASWERIEAFTTAQGFQHFYGRGDMPEDVEGSVWGCDDEYLYREVLRRTPADKDSFNVVLNVSNHSPYNVDLAAKGYPWEKVAAALPEPAKDDNGLLRELGHFWYADREMARFVKQLKAKYPDCLIVIVGDHADRYNIDKTPSIYERYGVPLIITGKGVRKGLLLSDSAGSQIDIAPTLFEMIAPQGFRYMSIGSSLTRSNRQGVNYGFWITRGCIGEADRVPLEPEVIPEGNGQPVDEPAMQLYIDAVRSISWWRPKYGPILDEKLLEGRE